MKLTLAPSYVKCNSTGLTWKLQRKEVVDVNSFLCARRLTLTPVGFPLEGDRPAEHMVAVDFYKGSGYLTLIMPMTDYRRIMRTNLEPTVA